MEKVTMKYIACIIIMFSLFFFSVANALSMKFDIHVVNEDGEPLEGAKVTVGFRHSYGWGAAYSKPVAKLTDNEGDVTVKGSGASFGGMLITKDGYYRGHETWKFTNKNKGINKLKPYYKQVKVVLRKIKNPVPMYARQGVYKLPILNKDVGFDLEKADWVAPYGKGIVSDFVINFKSNDRSFRNYDCNFTLNFSNSKDGFIEYNFGDYISSKYKWNYLAPDTGYNIQSLYKFSRNSDKDTYNSLYRSAYETNVNEKLNYIFRVRTKVDSSGNIISASWGKIKGDFRLYPKGEISFTYYFNPDGTKNLEFDPKKNLFNFKYQRDREKYGVDIEEP